MTASFYPLPQGLSPLWTPQRGLRRTVSLRVLAGITLFGDVAALVAMGTASALAAGLGGSGDKLGAWLLAILIAVAVAVSILRRRDLNTPRKLADLRCQLMPTAVATASAAVIGSACLLLTDVNGPHVAEWAIFWITGSAVSLTAARAILARIVQGWRETGRLDYKVAVIGNARAAQAFAERATLDEQFPVRVVGLYTPHPIDVLAAEVQAEPAFRGDLDTLLLDCRLRSIDAIVLAPGEVGADEFAETSAALEYCASDIYLVPGASEPLPKGARLRLLGACPVIALNEAPLQDWQAVAKGAFDKVVAATLLLCGLPLLGIVALLIRLDSPGPILFRQLRTGYNNTLFSMLKFRTMHHHMTDRQAAAQTMQGDQRVTRVGRVLRKLSIDELPQLINVLRGDMSLVGPRPHAPGTAVDGIRVDDLVPGYARRHHVRPGLTGLAQVNGSRGCMTTPEHVAQRLRYDLEYIEHWSLWLDCKIIALTVMREIFSRNAF